MATFVLIPGAGTAGSAWDEVAALLRDAGHGTVCVDLPSGDPHATLSSYTDAAEAALAAHAAEREPTTAAAPATDRAPTAQARADGAELVVVGQSLGAFTAAQLTARVPVSRLVYVCPMIPLPGETAGEWWGATGHAEAYAPVEAEHGPMESWDEATLNAVFLNDADAETAAAAARHFGEEEGGIFSSPLELDGPPPMPTRVIAGTVDRFFPPDFVARLARERVGVEPATIPTGHVPMLSRPAVLATALLATLD